MDQTKEYAKSSLIMLQDIALSMLATLLSILAVRWLSKPIYNFEKIVLESLFYSGIFSFLAFYLCGTHRIIVRYASLKSMGKFMLAGVMKEILLETIFLLKVVNVPTKMGLFIIGVDFLIMMFIILNVRVFYSILLVNKSVNPDKGISNLSVLINGTGEDSIALNAILGVQNRYNVLGFLTSDISNKGRILTDKKVYYYSEEKDIEKLNWMLGGVDGIVFPHSYLTSDKEAMRWCLDLGIQIIMLPEAKTISSKRSSEFKSMDEEGIVQDIIKDGMPLDQMMFKRLFDISASGILMILASPLFLICHLLIKRDDGGPVIYRQERIGRFGKPFRILKFRTMIQDAEANGAALYSGDNDERLTKIGKTLRKHHLDELPQLWNVFKGDMSYIGYRPERQFYIDQIMKINPRYKYLYQIRPGVTSYATLNNGYADSMEKMLTRLDLDLYYLAHRSIVFDLKILWRTFTSIVFGKVF